MFLGTGFIQLFPGTGFIELFLGTGFIELFLGGRTSQGRARVRIGAISCPELRESLGIGGFSSPGLDPVVVAV